MEELGWRDKLAVDISFGAAMRAFLMHPQVAELYHALSEPARRAVLLSELKARNLIEDGEPMSKLQEQLLDNGCREEELELATHCLFNLVEHDALKERTGVSLIGVILMIVGFLLVYPVPIIGVALCGLGFFILLIGAYQAKSSSS